MGAALQEPELVPEDTTSERVLPFSPANREGRNVVLFGGLQGAPVPSMERFADAMMVELPLLGWRAKLVRGRARSTPGPRAGRFAANEFSSRVLYPRLARRQRADVFHITDHSFGHIVDSLPRERTVVTCHDLMPWMVPGIFNRRMGRTIGLPLWERSVRALARAGHVACDSGCTRRDVIERIGCPEDRTSVVPLAASASFFALPAEVRRGAREGFGLHADACAVIHVGHSESYKNVEQVIRVVHCLRRQGVDAVFVKVGRVTAGQTQMMADLGMLDSFRPMSGISDDRLNALYNAVDVMLFPSKYEGYGLPPAEAMRAGLPVVTSDAEALLEVTAGFAPAFEPEDVDGMAEAIRKIWEDREHRERNTHEARLLAETYTWQRTASMMAAIYERLAV